MYNKILVAMALDHGVSVHTLNVARALLNDCFTGAWVRDITPDESGQTGRGTTQVSASPGDLDEAIRIAILLGDPGNNVDVVGSPFEKIDSFRTGVLGGLAACQAMLPD